MPTMPKQPFSALLKNIPVSEQKGPKDPMVSKIAFDSRNCVKGSLFVALPGFHVDGHDYIDVAISRGATAVVCTTLPEKLSPEVSYAVVPNSQHALSRASSAFYGEPSRRLPVVGVTGTDGKSTTVYLINQLLEAAGEECGFLSTVARKVDIGIEKNPYRQSTPEAPQIHEALYEMAEHGKRFAVLEATSHGLSEKTGRLMDVVFQAAVFTNITHEHLEFHGTFERYRSDKANLFRALDRTRSLAEHDVDLPIFGVVNEGDPNAYYFKQATRHDVLTYGCETEEADFYASDLQADLAGSSCVLHWGNEARRVRIPMVGSFNVENTLAALLTVAKLLDEDPLDLSDHLERLRPLPGRMSRISAQGAPFSLMVDYAHTPGAFQRVLPMIKESTENRLILVFGSAGERDLQKRPIQGSLAASYAEVVILADEDPRLEDPMTILEQIAAGVQEQWESTGSKGSLELIPDRTKAIDRAIELAQPGDTILCLGKGHESSIIYADGPRPWDEEGVARELLKKRGYEVRE